MPRHHRAPRNRCRDDKRPASAGRLSSVSLALDAALDAHGPLLMVPPYARRLLENFAEARPRTPPVALAMLAAGLHAVTDRPELELGAWTRFASQSSYVHVDGPGAGAASTLQWLGRFVHWAKGAGHVEPSIATHLLHALEIQRRALGLQPRVIRVPAGVDDAVLRELAACDDERALEAFAFAHPEADVAARRWLPTTLRLLGLWLAQRDGIPLRWDRLDPQAFYLYLHMLGRSRPGAERLHRQLLTMSARFYEWRAASEGGEPALAERLRELAVHSPARS